MGLPRRKTVSIRGVSYVVRRVKGLTDYGECDPPTNEGPEIRLRDGLTGRELLNTLTHEILHAGYWDASEEAICELADALEAVLWAMGYRNIHTDL